MSHYLNAINQRHSSRKYLGTPLDEVHLAYLRELIVDLNSKSGLCMQLVINDGNAFAGFSKSYGMFSGVTHYLALIGKTNDPYLKEKCGYYGEKVVLEATMMDLGTCWVGGTFSKKDCPVQVKIDETFICVIVLGNTPQNLSIKDKLIHQVTHRKSRSIESFYKCDCEVPKWFTRGIIAIKMAPSALNKQPVKMNYLQGIITAGVLNYDTHEAIDLGIAKLHFELATKEGHWQLGNNATYHSK